MQQSGRKRPAVIDRWIEAKRGAEGVLLTGVYASGKSLVAEEIACLLEQRGEPYALLDLDYLSWAGTGTGDRADEVGLMLQNLGAVAANYRGRDPAVRARLLRPQPRRGGRRA